MQLAQCEACMARILDTGFAPGFAAGLFST
jgi:hypothetical protein